MERDRREALRAERLGELARLFLRLGATAFGGPAAHIALVEHEVVGRRRWLDRARFLDLVGATNLIPGPNSTELAIHIGHDRAGAAGLVVAGVCFILPATLIVLVLAWAYVRFESLPASAGVLAGVEAVVVAIVAQALWRLGRAAIRDRTLAGVAVAAIAAVVLGVNELLVLLVAGVVAAGLRVGAGLAVAAAPLGVASATAATAVAATPSGLFWVFVKIGSVLFGSGYVLLAFLRTDLVERLGWLSEQQLLDAIAIGQVTPGPLFTTATFVGYLLAGVPGALAATAGIFLPAFVFVALTAPVIRRLRASPLTGGLLDGVNVASWALMAVVSVPLARAALVDVPSVLLCAASGALLWWGRIDSTWLVLGGALAGAARTLLA
ncbi:MAG: chromate efflux transporter [bacterium]|nr:chromate efflux transporter [bacterium]